MWPSASSAPQSGDGGCAPSPRKERPAVSTTTEPACRVAITRTGREAVRQNMAQHDAHGAAPMARAASTILGGPDRQHLAADQPRILRRVDDADGDHRVDQARPQRRDDDEREQQIGKRQQHVDHAHDQRRRPTRHRSRATRPSVVPTNERDAVGDDDREQRRARAVEHAAQHVAAILVGAEEDARPKAPAARCREILVVGIVGRDQGAATVSSRKASDDGGADPRRRAGAARARSRASDRGAAAPAAISTALVIRSGSADRAGVAQIDHAGSPARRRRR